MCKQVISEHWAHEEGGRIGLLLSKHFSTISSNQPSTQKYTCTTVERLKRLLNPRGQEHEIQIQTILSLPCFKDWQLIQRWVSICVINTNLKQH